MLILVWKKRSYFFIHDIPMTSDHNPLPVVIIQFKIDNCDRRKNVLILLIGKTTNAKYSGILVMGQFSPGWPFAELQTSPLTTFYSKKTRRNKSPSEQAAITASNTLSKTI